MAHLHLHGLRNQEFQRLGKAMDFNRNQIFLLGLLMLFFGFQFRVLDRFTLNDQTTRFLATNIQDNSESPLRAAIAENGALPKQEVKPPIWLGYSLLSIGAVLVLHSLTMAKPGGG
jgi:hypothetical protein